MRSVKAVTSRRLLLCVLWFLTGVLPVAALDYSVIGVSNDEPNGRPLPRLFPGLLRKQRHHFAPPGRLCHRPRGISARIPETRIRPFG